MRRIILPLLLATSILLAPAAAAADTATSSASPSAAADYSAEDARIAALLAKQLKNPRLGRDVVVNVTNLTTASTIFSHDPHDPQRPASNMKLITAVNALSQLGPDFIFRTQVLMATDPSQIYLKGGGDPTIRGLEARAEVRRRLDGDAFLI